MLKNPVLLALLSVTVILAACKSKEDPNAPRPFSGRMEKGVWYCDTPSGLRALGIPAASESENVASVEQPLDLAAWTLWTSRTIEVCWDDSTFFASQAAEREWTRQAVSNTWESALCGGEIPDSDCLKFIGWTRCSEGFNHDIRLVVEDSNPRAEALGRDLGRLGRAIYLNFSFDEWSPYCKSSAATREYCIRAIAAHEFGHGLGLAHEQNRGDSPDACDEAPQGSDGNVYLGPWDQDSIMNYCAPVWNNGGVLSPGDIQWIRVAYYPEYYSELCVPLSVYDPSLAEEVRTVGLPSAPFSY